MIGIIHHKGSRALGSTVNTIMLVGPFLGVGVAILQLWGGWIGWLDLGLLLGGWIITTLGITVGWHRYFTHKSFQAPRGVEVALAMAGSLAVQGELISWVAEHTRHHRYADKEGDPHSPIYNPNGGGRLRGFWHAHMGWFFDPNRADPAHYAPHLVGDLLMRRISSLFPLWTIISFTLPGFIGLAVTQTWRGAFSAFVLGGPVRIFLMHHLTFSINSVTHTFGTRPFSTTDRSTNLWPLAVFTGGEAWHNNHHAFPRSARLGLKWWQPDPGWYLIRTMKMLRLVRNVRIPTADQVSKVMARRRPATFGI